jgi:hypothetical protein
MPNDSLPSSQSSTSLASSFSSSAASSMLYAAPPSNSSESDFLASDHSTSSSPSKASSPVHPSTRALSLANMGQTYSRVPHSLADSAVPPPSKGFPLSRAETSAKSKFKRVFGGGLKNTEDVFATASHLFGRNGKGKERDRGGSSIPVGAKLRTLQLASTVFSGRKQSLSPTSPTSPDLPPPPPPPKRDVLSLLNKPLPFSNSTKELPIGSPTFLGPNVSAALDFMRASEEGLEQGPVPTSQHKGPSDDATKCDSSTNNYTPHRRPNSGVGSCTSRPVSMADSLQSNHTIVPVNKRRSALFTEAEFTMAEEDNGQMPQEPSATATSTQRSSPTPSLRSRNRRSLSLKVGSNALSTSKAAVSPSLLASASEADLKCSSTDPLPRHTSDGSLVSLSIKKETLTLTRTAANGIIIPSSTSALGQTTGSQIRGRLAAWTAASDMTSASSDCPSSLAIPPTYSLRPLAPSGGPGFRKTTISITNGFAPAAGLAKRAVEKMGRAWGGISSGSSHAGHSLTSLSRTTPASFTSTSSDGLSRTDSRQSSIAHQVRHSKGKSRRAPHAPSGAWSPASSNTSSSGPESDVFPMPAGPVLGECVRGPISSRTGAGVLPGGILFGRDLKSAVRDTAVDIIDEQSSSGRLSEDSGIDLRALEGRKLPALVVRCVQHLLLWGIQEEGLFRCAILSSHQYIEHF